MSSNPVYDHPTRHFSLLDIEINQLKTESILSSEYPDKS
jgi:hypothetical protein